MKRDSRTTPRIRNRRSYIGNHTAERERYTILLRRFRPNSILEQDSLEEPRPTGREPITIRGRILGFRVSLRSEDTVQLGTHYSNHVDRKIELVSLRASPIARPTGNQGCVQEIVAKRCRSAANEGDRGGRMRTTLMCWLGARQLSPYSGKTD
jgi:hypothetical protein